MASVASRDLRNHTAAVLRRVTDGESVTITVNGSPVAELIPPGSHRSRFLHRSEVARLISVSQSDPVLAHQLEELAGETTDDLDPLR